MLSWGGVCDHPEVSERQELKRMRTQIHMYPHVQVSQDEVFQNLNKTPRMVFDILHILCVMGQLHRTLKSHNCYIWL